MSENFIEIDQPFIIVLQDRRPFLAGDRNVVGELLMRIPIEPSEAFLEIGRPLVILLDERRPFLIGNGHVISELGDRIAYLLGESLVKISQPFVILINDDRVLNRIRLLIRIRKRTLELSEPLIQVI